MTSFFASGDKISVFLCNIILSMLLLTNRLLSDYSCVTPGDNICVFIFICLCFCQLFDCSVTSSFASGYLMSIFLCLYLVVYVVVK